MEIGIDWSTAAVHEGRLVVELDEKPSKTWRARFRFVVDQIESSSDRWGAVTTAKRQIEVSGVEAGAEDDLRHRLESIVAQANADTATDGSGDSDADAEMTATFRGFG